MGLGAGAGSDRRPPPDHQISCFAPGRVYVVRHPRAGQGPSAAIAAAGPDRRGPTDRAGPPAPTTGDYVNGTPGYFGSRPRTPADPYRPRTVRSRSARIPTSARRRRRRTGGIPEPSTVAFALSEPVHVGRRCRSSTPAHRRRASMAPIPREPRTTGMPNISTRSAAGAVGRQKGPSPTPPQGHPGERTRGPVLSPARAEARAASSFRTSGFTVSYFGQTLSSGPVHRTVRAPNCQRAARRLTGGDKDSEFAKLSCGAGSAPGRRAGEGSRLGRPGRLSYTPRRADTSLRWPAPWAGQRRLSRRSASPEPCAEAADTASYGLAGQPESILRQSMYLVYSLQSLKDPARF